VSKLLREGDIIELRPGHRVYMRLPAHFIYANRVGVFDKLAKTEVTIGAPQGGMDTAWVAGRYVVTATAMKGGGTAHGPHDVYPDGHHVKAERMDEDDRTVVEFYQTGCFTAMIPDIEPVGRAKATWHEAPTEETPR